MSAGTPPPPAGIPTAAAPTAAARTAAAPTAAEPRDVPGLGGGLNPWLVEGRQAGVIEKRHLVLTRYHAARAAARGVSLIDVGTDYGYPFYDAYPPTLAALAALGEEAQSARVYPSSYGSDQLRRAVVAFMAARFGINLYPDGHVMVSTGASQVFDAVSRTFAGPLVLVPELTLSTVTTIAIGNGAHVQRVPLNSHGLPDLTALRGMARLAGGRIRFLYLNSPANPTGAVAGADYLARLVDIARAHRLLIVHDHDSWHTVHLAGDRPRHTDDPDPGPSAGAAAAPASVNILQIPGALDVAVTVLSLSKELGLPGLRVGAVAGNPKVINALRIHNSEFCVMIPEFAQAAAAAALNAYVDEAHAGPAAQARDDVQRQITAALHAALAGWQSLGWPPNALLPPAAGYKFLFRPPPAFRQPPAPEAVAPHTMAPADLAPPSGAELFDFLLGLHGVKVSTVRSFNPSRWDWLRMIIMQPAEVMEALFGTLAAAGIHYDMPPPADDLMQHFHQVTAGLDLSTL